MSKELYSPEVISAKYNEISSHMKIFDRLSKKLSALKYDNKKNPSPESKAKLIEITKETTSCDNVLMSLMNEHSAMVKHNENINYLR